MHRKASNRTGWLLVALCGLVRLAAADEPKPEPKPTVLTITPAGIVLGKPARLTLRGLKLAAATEVRVTLAGATAKIVSAGGVETPRGQSAAKVGDTRVEVELTLPPDAPAGLLGLTVVTPQGEAPERKLLVGDESTLVHEVEPNGGFRKAQPLELSKMLLGSIHDTQNVDVFRFRGAKGQKLAMEITAAREGSALDAVLTLYDALGRTIASADDSQGLDPILEVTLPADGDYYVGVVDAFGQGGSSHPYRLHVRDVKN